MNDRVDSLEEPSAAELAALHRLLARADLWDEPSPEVESNIVAAIAAEAGADAVRPPRASSRSAMPWWLAAAAVVAVVAVGVAFVARGDDRPSGIEIAMTGTDAAPDASATVVLASTPAGLKILLDAEGLPGAPEGYYYEAWISDGTTRISAGTFHLRRSDNEIELWAGVVDPGFTTLSVTLEPVDDDTDSSGDVRLVGRYDLADD